MSKYRYHRQLRAVAAAAAVFVFVTACSTAGSPFAATADPPEVSSVMSDVTGLPTELQELLGSEVMDALDSSDDENVDEPDDGTFRPGDTYTLAPLHFHLWEEAVTPTDWHRIPSQCDAPGGETMADGGAGWFTFAVPSDWVMVARGSAGSNDPLGDTHDASFSSTVDNTKSDVTISIAVDQRDDAGNLVTWDGDISDGSFDYDYSTYSSESESHYRITFDAVSEVPLGEQQLEVFVADQAQEPEVLSETVYKVRFQIVEVPAPDLPEGTVPVTAVLSISHDATTERSALASDTVLSIVRSLQLPPCTAKTIVVGSELQWSADLDGDGYVSTAEDYQAVLALGRN